MKIFTPVKPSSLTCQKYSVLLIILLFPIQFCFAQIFELAEDLGYQNQLTSIINVGDSMWVYTGHYYFENVGEFETYIKAIDIDGNTIWEYSENSVSTAHRISEIAKTEDDVLISFGTTNIACDVAQSEGLKLLYFNSTGNLIDSKTYNVEINAWPPSIRQGITTNAIFIAFESYNQDNFESDQVLFATSLLGDSLWLQNFTNQEIKMISNLENAAAVFFDEQLILIDAFGTHLDSIEYVSAPIDVVSFEDEVLILWSDGIYSLDSNYELNLVVEIEAETNSRLLVQDGMIYLITNNLILSYNAAYEPQSVVSFNPIPYVTPEDFAINNNTLAIVGRKKFEEVAVGNQSAYRSGVVYTVSLDGEQLNHFPDLAIGSLWIETPTVVQTNNNPMLFTIDVDVAGYIVNTGDVTVNIANVTFIGDQGICGYSRESVSLENISLAPGDSVYFELSELRYTQQHFPSGSGTRTFCVFVSAPNNLSDRDETNDINCVSHSFTVGLSEYFNNSSLVVYPNPATDQIFIQSDNREFPTDATFNLFDLQGRLHLSSNIQSGSTIHQIDMSHLSSGIYFLQCATPEELLWRWKVIKE